MAVFRNLARWRALSGEGRRTLLAAWWSLLGADLALRGSVRLALRRPLASPAGAAGAVGGPDLAAAREVAAAVATAANHHLWTMSCLPRALALWRLLAGRGIPARLRLGVRRGAGLAAHAWVEVAGESVGESGAIDGHYAPLEAVGPADSGGAAAVSAGRPPASGRSAAAG